MTTYTFDDVLIKPKYSEIESRTQVDTSVNLGNIKLKLPVFTANMKTVTGPNMALTANENGAMGILHRFNNIEENVEEFNTTFQSMDYVYNRDVRNTFGVSIGIKEEDKKRFNHLSQHGARIFCLDVAHGHQKRVKDMLDWIDGFVGHDRDSYTFIVGNIATPEAFYDLTEWGADIIKVGIGPGKNCQTRRNTGVGVPQLYALEQIHKQRESQIKRPYIIADGGLGTVGDVSKALKYADAVMMGSFFSGCSETPGNVFRNDKGEFYKVYGGSASGENKGTNSFVEGVTSTTPFRGKSKYLFKEIKEGLQSAMSYTGSKNLQEYKENCEFVFVSGSSKNEGHYN